MSKMFLGDVCLPESSNIAQKDLTDKDGQYPIYGASGLISHVNFYRQECEYIAVVKDGAGIGRVFLLPPYSSVIGTMQYILPKPNIDVHYLYFAMQFMNLAKYYSGSTIPHIYFKNYKHEPIKLPPLEKQREIADTLETIKQTEDNLNEQITHLDELVKSQFVELFGDPVTNPHNMPMIKLKNLSTLITKGASPNWQGYAYSKDTNQTLFITSENVRENFIDISQPKYIENTFNVKQKRSLLQKGDVLINIVGASIGRAAKFDIDVRANINQAVALVRIQEASINPEYLLQYLNSEKALQMYDSMKSDVARANLSLQDIGNLDILMPPRVEQDKYANFTQQVDKSKLVLHELLEKQKTLKASLMQKYFS